MSTNFVNAVLMSKTQLEAAIALFQQSCASRGTSPAAELAVLRDRLLESGISPSEVERPYQTVFQGLASPDKAVSELAQRVSCYAETLFQQEHRLLQRLATHLQKFLEYRDTRQRQGLWNEDTDPASFLRVQVPRDLTWKIIEVGLSFLSPSEQKDVRKAYEYSIVGFHRDLEELQRTHARKPNRFGAEPLGPDRMTYAVEAASHIRTRDPVEAVLGAMEAVSGLYSAVAIGSGHFVHDSVSLGPQYTMIMEKGVMALTGLLRNELPGLETL